jgi:hypothetical protein
LALGAVADSFGKRTGFGLAVVLCAAGVWTLRTIVLPGDRARTMPTPAPIPAPVYVPVAGD